MAESPAAAAAASALADVGGGAAGASLSWSQTLESLGLTGLLQES